MSIKGILWDMDGVLVDNGELHYQAWKATLLITISLFPESYSRKLLA